MTLRIFEETNDREAVMALHGWLNGAEVGSDSIIAAGALVTERTVIPPRSMVMGSPGKVKRELTDDEVRSVLGYAQRYVGYRLDYMAQS